MLNGIDQHMWNPVDDSLLPPFGHYHANDTRGKEVCKQALLAELGLPYLNPAEREGMCLCSKVLLGLLLRLVLGFSAASATCCE